MNDLAETVGLTSILGSGENFELAYEQLIRQGCDHEAARVRRAVWDYFVDLELPDDVTVYDQLILSLRAKDLIFTFNWDPFLFDTWARNSCIDGVQLPEIHFLHGNVRVGICKGCCGKWGRVFTVCPECGDRFSELPLLFPESDKNYEGNWYIRSAWEQAKELIANAFTVTVFGYGAPASDRRAVELLKRAWLSQESHVFKQVEVVDIKKEIDCDSLYNSAKACSK